MDETTKGQPPQLCEWYAMCANVATLDVDHPILGPMPTCTRCADKHELKGTPR